MSGTVRKKIDPRIRTLVENCVKLRQRGMFVIIGDRGRDQVVNLHYMLSKATVKARPSVLWCYKKDLYLSRCVQEGARLMAHTSLHDAWARSHGLAHRAAVHLGTAPPPCPPDARARRTPPDAHPTHATHPQQRNSHRK